MRLARCPDILAAALFATTSAIAAANAQQTNKLETLKPAKVELVNVARDAKVEVNRSHPENGVPERINDGVTTDAAQGWATYWFIRLRLKKATEVHSVRILTPIGATGYAQGLGKSDYDVSGLNGGVKSVLASVENGKHPKTEPGPIPNMQWT